jgi:nucleoid-associated protein YgaU
LRLVLGLGLLAAVGLGALWWFGLREAPEETAPQQRAAAPSSPAAEETSERPESEESSAPRSAPREPEAADSAPDNVEQTAEEDIREPAQDLASAPRDETDRAASDTSAAPARDDGAPASPRATGTGSERSEPAGSTSGGAETAEPRSTGSETAAAVSETGEPEAEPERSAAGATDVQTAARPDAAAEDRETEAASRTPETPASGKPSFDVVRIERDGSSVMAGRAAPDSEVVVRRDGEEVARGRADARGEFVLLPEKPLPPGDYALELESESPSGERVRGEQTVVVSVPETGAPAGQAGDQAAAARAPLVVEVPSAGSGDTRILQMPEPTPSDSAGGLWLEAVDYDPDGQLSITGRGLAGQRVVAYLDNAPLGETEVGEEGRWRLRPAREVKPGLYTLRVDQLDAGGEVTARVESPFARTAFDTADLPSEERFVVIQPGNNLWTIARRTYGEGPRYTVIFQANEDQIRDPDLIYPGQIFVLPRNGQSG